MMRQLTTQQLKNWIEENKDFALIDIRENWERETYNIGGEHIPMGDIMSRLNEIPKDKDVVIYCEKGIRSVISIQRLENHGFHNLYNLNGGINAWKDELNN
jgi:rhodanese-related sulfurtransferase